MTCTVDQFLLQSGSDEKNDLLCIGSLVETYTLNMGIGLAFKIEFWMKVGSANAVDAALNNWVYDWRGHGEYALTGPGLDCCERSNSTVITHSFYTNPNKIL